MSTTASRRVSVAFSGDVEAEIIGQATNNAASPGQTQIVTLSSGANTITPPSGGSTPTAVTIIPPAGNTALITLKGITGDTGVVLHKTDPTSIGLNSPTDTFVLTAGASIAGVRLVWS